MSRPLHLTLAVMPAAVLVLCSIPTASAQVFTPTSQQRRTSVMVLVPRCMPNTMSFNEQAGDFAPFDSDLRAERDCDVAHGVATAAQRSTIGAAWIDMHGSAGGQATATAQTIIHAISSSTFDLTVSITAPIKFHLSGTLYAERTGEQMGVSSGAQLQGPGNIPVFVYGVTPGTGGMPRSQPVLENRLLAPGSYTFRAIANTGIDHSIPPNRGGQTSYALRALLALPGDVNLDQHVDALDAAALAAALIGMPNHPDHLITADVNCDGVADGLDIQSLVDRLIDG